MNTDDATWERKRKGSTRRNEKDVTFCEPSQAPRKLPSTVGQRLGTMNAVLCGHVHQLRTEALAPGNQIMTVRRDTSLSEPKG